MNDNGNDPHPMEVVRALRERGIDNPEDLLQFGTPSQILAACRRWDTRQNAGPGLLARMIRNQEFPDEGPPPGHKAARLRARFDDYATRFPEDTIAEAHHTLLARRWPDEPDPCAGRMIVIETTYPLITAECDACGFVAAYPVRDLHVLGPPTLQPAEPPSREEQPF